MRMLLQFSLISLVLLPPTVWCQSLVSGDLAGAVYDISGRTLPHALLTVKNNDSEEILNSVTNTAGAYLFHFSNPGPTNSRSLQAALARRSRRRSSKLGNKQQLISPWR